jgi:4-amino-4-deoxy-L-arabinose transferase-like glycosyltransferase
MLVALATVSLAVRLSCLTGLVASDDLGYSYFAEQIATGEYRLVPHHFAIRYGLLLPLAGLYRLFGVHEWTTLAIPLAASTLAPPLAALVALRLSGPVAAWIVGLLLASFPIEVRFATILVPEPLAGALLLLAALLVAAAHERGSPVLASVAGVALGWAYLTKETSVFVGAAFVLFAVWRRDWKLAGSLCLGAALVVAAELAWYWSQSGDLLFRPHALGEHNQTPEAVDANRELWYRLWKAYPRAMLVPNAEFGVHSTVALALAAAALALQRQARTLWLLLWTAVPGLYLNFGSTSWGTYWVMPAIPRYLGIIYPPLFLLAACLLADWMGRRGRRRVGVALLVVATFVVGVGAARLTRGTGFHTASVHRLRTIVAGARAGEHQLCGVTEAQPLGFMGSRWGRVLQILGPDVLGCGPTARRVVPDAGRLPMVELAPSRSVRGP